MLRLSYKMSMVRTVSLVMNARRRIHKCILWFIYKLLFSKIHFIHTQMDIGMYKCKINPKTKISFTNTFLIHTQMYLVLNKCNINPYIGLYELKKYLQFSWKMYLDVVTFIYKLLNLNKQDAFHLWTCLHLCLNWSVFTCGFLRLSWRGWIHKRFFSTWNSL